MSSPVEIPLSNVLAIDRHSEIPVYIQIARKMISAIQRGVLVPGVKLPGTRVLAGLLNVHRKTVVAALNEVDAQGWIEVIPNKGVFVTENALVQGPSSTQSNTNFKASYPEKTGFNFHQSMLLDRPIAVSRSELEFTDGLPDVRLAPLNKLAKTYSAVFKRKGNNRFLGYSDVEGNAFFRDQLTSYLNNTRGLHVSRDNMITTRGVQMGIYMASMLLIRPGDCVVVGNLSYYVSNMIFQQAGANIRSVPVDEDGISVEAVRKLCATTTIRMLYITPHHHYPTTVTLSAERRIELLNLSVQYGFVILEDDYDYDFHYDSSPMLPLASADASGMVVYIGSFCKALAPGLRSGYIVAPKNFIVELAKLRRIIDRQGDLMMEQTLGEMLEEGEIQRHLKKARKIYHERRDLFCQLLKSEFSNELIYNPPPGGLAVWTQWNTDINLMKVSRECQKRNLYLPQTLLFQTNKLSAVRLGFGNLNEAEIVKAMEMLKEAVSIV